MMTIKNEKSFITQLVKGNNFEEEAGTFIKNVALKIQTGNLSFRQAAKEYKVTKYQVEKWVACFRKENGIQSLPRAPLRIFQPDDWPLITEMITAIKSGSVTQIQAAKTYNVSGSEIKRWLRVFNKNFFSPETYTIDPLIKKKIIQDVYCGKMSKRNASQIYKIDLDVIGMWISKLPGYTEPTFSDEQITNEVKVQVVRKIQADEMTKHKAARQYNVHPLTVGRWIRDYSIFNSDGSICNQILYNMNPEQQQKELLDQIKKLKEQLEHEKLKNEALKTLIEVAEEKFGLQIKKKHGVKLRKK